jgi:hypothetical protein
MHRLIVTLPTGQTPRCPICLEPLNGNAVEFIWNLAHCAQCAQTITQPMIDAHNWAISSPTGIREVSIIKGLLLWTPPPTVPLTHSFYLHCLHNDPFPSTLSRALPG